MASTLACANVVLIDNYPGTVDRRAPEPKDGFLGADHFNNTSAIFEPGTKREVWDATTGGPVILCYLRNKTLGTGPKATIAGTIASPHTTQWEVSTDPDVTPPFSINRGQIAVALGVIALESYGFWWIGGVCPADSQWFSSSMAAVNLITDGSVALATPLMLVDETADLGIKIFTGDVMACGFSKIADV